MKEKRKKGKRKIGSLVDGLGMDFGSTEEGEGGRWGPEALVKHTALFVMRNHRF